MTRIPKYLYPWAVQGNYGYGWDDEVQEDTRAEIVVRYREYVRNGGGTYRIVRRRVPNPAYVTPPDQIRYTVVRGFRDSDRHTVVARGLTLEQAQAHCSDPQASSRTATGHDATARTARYGPWFDGYTAE